MTPRTPDPRAEHSHQSFSERDACPECVATIRAARPVATTTAVLLVDRLRVGHWHGTYQTQCPECGRLAVERLRKNGYA